MKITESIVKSTKTSLVSNQAIVHEDVDVLALLLEDKRSPETKRAYQGDIKMFFQVMFGTEPTREMMKEFLALSQGQAIALVIKYKGLLIKSGLKEASINRKLASIKSLAKFARKVGHCNFALEDVSSEKIKSYRDTSGISEQQFKQVLSTVDRNTQIGKRDFAILVLLWSNALRRGELSKLTVQDFDYDNHSLWILGKGKGTSRERVKIPRLVADAIVSWLATRKPSTLAGKNVPLFAALDFFNAGHALTGDMVSKLVQKYCKLAGITKKMSAHRIRHSSITSALDSTGGNVRKVKDLSRHSKIETLMLYDDNRNQAQGEISDLLADGIF